MPTAEHFEVESTESSSGVRILKLMGPLTLQSLFEFQEVVRVDHIKPIILDLAGVAYMDSGGLGSVISVFASCQRTDRGFAIFGVSDRIQTLFKVTRVDGLLPCFPSLEAAEQSLRT